MRPTGEPRRSPTGMLRRLNFNCIAAAAFIGLGVALSLLIPSQIEKPLLILGQGSDGLDPALFPSLVAGALIVLGLWFLVAAFAMREVNGLRELDGEAWGNVGFSLVAFLAYALLMEPLGFVLSSVLLIGSLSLFYGARDLRLVLGIAVGVPVVIYYTFTVALKTFLPEAPWS